MTSKTSEYSAYLSTVGDLESTIYESLEFINWKKQIKNDSNVFIKPNFTFPAYKKGITTSPELLKQLLAIIKNRADEVIIGESDGGNRSFSATDAFKGHNMYEICKDAGVNLVNLSKLPSEFVEEAIQGKRIKCELPKLLLTDVDCLVSVPVLKVHVMTQVSLSIKNLWGCYPDTMRCLHHKHLDYKLPLITKLLNPKLVVVDGTYALDGHGPMFGTPIEMNLIYSANNPVVADSLGAELMGISPRKIKHIVIAEREGLGTIDLQKVRLSDDLEKFKRKFNIRKTFLDRVSWLLFNSDTLAKLVMDSSFTPLIYKIAGILRSQEEKEVKNELKGYYI